MQQSINGPLNVYGALNLEGNALTGVANLLSNPMITMGDTIYGGISGTPTKLSGPTSAAIYFMTETGTGTNAQAPAWTIAGSLAFLNVGTGLQSGGGALNVAYGYLSGTAAQGNDYRILGAEQTINKDAPSGYPGLNSSGYLKSTEFPAFTGDCANTAGTTVLSCGTSFARLGTGTLFTALIGGVATTPFQGNVAVGLYTMAYALHSTVSCSVPGPGSVTLTIGYTDNVGATGQSVTMALGTTSTFNTGQFTFYVGSVSSVSYGVAYTACSTGTGTYSLALAAPIKVM
jgi:hypothetical protein